MRPSAWLAFALTWAASLPALAFSDPLLFGADPLEGGGGGRWFTGSRRDGYSCKVCHAGGLAPEPIISGLPLEYVPGATYDVQITWSYPQVSHALTLELVGASGLGVQSVALADHAASPVDERCEQAADGEPASYIAEAGQRRIVGMSDCGAAALRFRFTAPPEPELTLALAMVRSDSMGTPDGDGVIELTRTLRRTGSARAQAAGGCSLEHGGGASAAPFSLLLLGVLLRRRRVRRPA